MKFLDEAKIFIRSGVGGDGRLSFRRERNIPFGGPDGGNGGDGGDIIFCANIQLNTLFDFRYKQHYKASSGLPGEKRNKSGANAEHLEINVPVGTQILSADKSKILAEINHTQKKITILKGGKGGIGNAQFKSSTNQAPKKIIPGGKCSDMWVWLKLKLIADIGLIGLPNAGKSTLLNTITKAHPKIASYPFTTLYPHLGVMYYDKSEFIVADIPGLIEGAHKGVGLGNRFLSHIEKCSFLIHIIDVSSKNYLNEYQVIRNELSSYSKDIIKKEEFVIFNKIDLIDQNKINKYVLSFKKKYNIEPFLISALKKENIKQFLQEISNKTKIIKRK